MDAGSIPYSAVVQPRPWPAIQRGTDSSTLAVQITRVPPASISAEPVALLMKPGMMLIVAQIGRAAAVRPAPLHAHAAARAPGERDQVHVVDLADRQLEEARAEAPELLQRRRVARKR